MRSRPWVAFAILSIIWGSSFLWIKIALQEVGPFTLVAFRLLFGLTGLLTIARLLGVTLRPKRKNLFPYLFLAILNTALPFTLISWGETRIESAMAAILTGTMPLFTAMIAHFWLQEEKLTSRRVSGLLLGFLGVAVLVSGSLNVGSVLGGDFLGQLAVLGAAGSYAVAITFSRKRLRGEPPILQATATILISALLLWIAVLAFEGPLRLPSRAISWIALLWLGLLGTGLAYVLYFYLISTWGSTRSSVVTYVMPIVGLILGVTFLGEAMDARLILGAALVIGGVLFTNVKLRLKADPMILQKSAANHASGNDRSQ